MNWGVNRALEPLLVPIYMPLAIKGKEAYGEGGDSYRSSMSLSSPSQELRAGEQESGERVGVGYLTQRSTGY